MEIEPREAATVLRIFSEYGDGQSLTAIVKKLNREAVPGRIRSSKGWSPATVGRILDNEKYVGRWVWNRSESRRDPHTGRRRRFAKPESEWTVQTDERLRIVPIGLWEAVRARRTAVRRTWPGEQRRGFSSAQGSREEHFPTHLLSGTMLCGSCGGAIAQVSGKSGGYYGCLAASKRACTNRILVRRSLAEKLIINAVRDRLGEPEEVARVLERVEQAVAELRSDLPETLRLKEAELASEERRLGNFLDFIGEGRGSKALGQAIVVTERRVEGLRDEVGGLRASRERVFRAPPVDWIRERLDKLQEVLGRNTSRSAVLLRQFLGPIRLEPVQADIGRPYYRAITAIDVVALIDTPPDSEGPDGGSNSLRSWRWRESNPRPRASIWVFYGRSRRGVCRPEAPTGGGPQGQPVSDVRRRPTDETATVSLLATPGPRTQAIRGGRLPAVS
jgi:hypothetical protein